MCNLLKTALIIALLLTVSGNVELIPGPMKKCPKCEKMMLPRSINCRCGHLLCYVSARFCTLVHSFYIVVGGYIRQPIYKQCLQQCIS